MYKISGRGDGFSIFITLNRKGGYQLLEDMQEKNAVFQVEVVEKACYDGEEISSTGSVGSWSRVMELVNQLTTRLRLFHDRRRCSMAIRLARTWASPSIPAARLSKLLPPSVYATKRIASSF